MKVLWNNISFENKINNNYTPTAVYLSGKSCLTMEAERTCSRLSTFFKFKLLFSDFSSWKERLLSGKKQIAYDASEDIASEICANAITHQDLLVTLVLNAKAQLDKMNTGREELLLALEDVPGLYQEINMLNAADILILTGLLKALKKSEAKSFFNHKYLISETVDSKLHVQLKLMKIDEEWSLLGFDELYFSYENVLKLAKILNPNAIITSDS